MITRRNFLKSSALSACALTHGRLLMHADICGGHAGEVHYRAHDFCNACGIPQGYITAKLSAQQQVFPLALHAVRPRALAISPKRTLLAVTDAQWNITTALHLAPNGSILSYAAVYKDLQPFPTKGDLHFQEEDLLQLGNTRLRLHQGTFVRI